MTAGIGDAARDRPSEGDDEDPPDRSRRRRRTAGIELDCGAPADVRHVGIVLVHGIGSQSAGETLLDWGGAITRGLVDARVRHGASADPVIAAHLDIASGGSRHVELQLPATTIDQAPVPEQHWVLTEAWWAERVRPPAFSQMARWLGPRGAVQRILMALLPRKRGVHDPRLRSWAARYHLRRGAGGEIEEAAEPGPPDGMRKPPGDPVQRAMMAFGGALYLQAIAAVVLVLYGALRSIEKLVPIGPFRDGALTRPLDRFVLEWFGDAYVLLSDPAQAASIRTLLVDALADLHAAGCSEVVVVAHSGGAIVTYMTLADGSNDRLHVDRLITLGEGLNLAWRLTQGEQGHGVDDAAVQYDRLYRAILAARPDLHWDDFWASQDPAPVGVLNLPPAPAEDELLARVESRAVWNRLSYREDHGGYWENDEEFLVPLLRILEGRVGEPTLFGDESRDQDWSNRRRRRLSLLSLWRQVCFVAPTAGVVIAFCLGADSVPKVGDAVAAAFSLVPGHEIVTEPVAWLRTLGLADTGLGRFAAETGTWVIAAVIGLASAFALIAPPERPIPWAYGDSGAWVGRALRIVPWLAGIPISVALVYAAARFLGGSTPDAIDVGRIVGVAALTVLVLAVVARAIISRRPRAGGAPQDVIDTILMMTAMVVAIGLIASPFLAMIVFPDVGRVVLGTVAVVVAFQILGRVGGWRWSVWDTRERTSLRTGRTYAGTGRVLVQVALLSAISGALFLAVVLASMPALVAAVAGVALLVLLGVAIDVLDAVREDQTAPADSIRRATLREKA